MDYYLLFGFASDSTAFREALKAKVNNEGWTFLPPVQESWNATQMDTQLLATLQKPLAPAPMPMKSKGR